MAVEVSKGGAYAVTNPSAADAQQVAVSKGGAYVTVGPSTQDQPQISVSKGGAYAVVIATAAPSATCTLSATPPSIAVGQSSVLSWTTQNATSAVLQPGNVPVPLSGSLSVTPVVTTTYTLEVTGDAGDGSCIQIVTVVPAPQLPSCVMSVAPTGVLAGQHALLTWSSLNSTSASLSGGEFGAGTTVATSGSQSVTPPFSPQTTYTLTVTNDSGQAQCSATVAILQPVPPPPPSPFPGLGVCPPGAPPPPLPTCAMSVTPDSIEPGQSATLNWISAGATSLRLRGTGAVPLNGSIPVSPATTTTYVIDAIGPGGVNLCAATLTVIPATILLPYLIIPSGMNQSVTELDGHTSIGTQDTTCIDVRGELKRMAGDPRSVGSICTLKLGFAGECLSDFQTMHTVQVTEVDWTADGLIKLVTQELQRTLYDDAWLDGGPFPRWAPANRLPGDRILDANGSVELCIVGSGSGADEPFWSTKEGEYTYDGNVLWQNQGKEAAPPGPAFASNGLPIDSKNPRYLQGNPMDILLVCAQNEVGIGQNPDADPTQWKLYVPGNDSTLINPNLYLDVPRILELRDNDCSGDWMEFKLTSSQTAKSWMEDQILKPLGLFTVQRPDGVLTFKSMKSPGISPTVAQGVKKPVTYQPSVGTSPDPDLDNSAFQNLGFAFDGNLTTNSSNTVSLLLGATICSASWSGFPSTAGAGLTSVQLAVNTSAKDDTFGQNGIAYAQYSTDGGTTWTDLWSDATHAQRWDYAALPDGIDLAQVQVRVYADGSLSPPIAFGLGQLAVVYEIQVTALIPGQATSNNGEAFIAGSLTDRDIMDIPESSRWPVINHVTVRLETQNQGSNTSAKQYRSDLTFQQLVSQEQFRQVYKHQVEANGWRLGWGGAQLAWLLADRIFRRHAFATPEYTFKTFLKNVIYELADYVLLTHRLLLNVNDPAGVRGVTDLLCEVTDKQPKYESGHIEFKLADCRFMGLTTPFLIAPDGTSTFQFADPATQQAYMFIANDDGTNTDGSAAPTMF